MKRLIFWLEVSLVFVATLPTIVFGAEIFNFSSHTGTYRYNADAGATGQNIVFKLGHPLFNGTITKNANFIDSFARIGTSTAYTDTFDVDMREYSDSNYQTMTRVMFYQNYVGSCGGGELPCPKNPLLDNASSAEIVSLPSDGVFDTSKYYLIRIGNNSGANTVGVDTDGSGSQSLVSLGWDAGAHYNFNVDTSVPSFCLGTVSSTDCRPAGGGDGGSSSTIAFVYPTSSVYYYQPFAYIWTAVTGVSSSSLYQDTVTVCDMTYSQCVVQPFYQWFSGAHQDASGTYLQRWANWAENNDLGIATSTVVGMHAILKDALGTILSSATLQAHQLSFKHGTKNPNGTTTLMNVTPIFDASGTYTGITTSTGYVGGVIAPMGGNSTSTGGQWCVAPDNWGDWGGEISYGGCMLFSWLFNPNTVGNNDLAQAFINFEQTPPFVFVFTPINLMMGEGSSLTTASTSDLSFSLPAAAGKAGIIPTSSFKVIDNTAFAAESGDSTLDSSVHDQLFFAEDMVMTLMLLAFTFKILVKPRKGYH